MNSPLSLSHCAIIVFPYMFLYLFCHKCTQNVMALFSLLWSSVLETPPPAYMSEDGGSPRPDPSSMETGDTVPPGKLSC